MIIYPNPRTPTIQHTTTAKINIGPIGPIPSYLP